MVDSSRLASRFESIRTPTESISPSLTGADLTAIAEYLLVAQQDIVRTANELRVQHPASPLIDRMMAHAGAAADLRARILGL